MKERIEKDMLGILAVPKDALWGIHSQRARENFNLSSKKIHSGLIYAYAAVKLACAKTNHQLGYIKDDKIKFIEKACLELMDGQWNDQIIVHPLQGGAGTSTNLNICEVIANRTLQLMGKSPGDYQFCDPIEEINLHQSTNDTYPTALRVAAYNQLNLLESAIVQLHQEMEAKEQQYARVLKVGRTELMDAVPTTFGRMFGAWAGALSRDRWRIFKCKERLRVINLGGTAIGTGLGAPRDFIFKADAMLRTLTRLPLSRAEHLVDATQNQDALVEVMGILKAHASTLMKIAGDLKLLSMGPEAGLNEIILPAVQAGSSIMPHKVNPVIPEMVTQVAIQVMASDQAVALAVGLGQLELNAQLPLVAMHLLETLELLTRVNVLTASRCIKELNVNETSCESKARRSSALATALIPLVGYHQAGKIAALMREEQLSLEAAAERIAGLSAEQCAQCLTPEALSALGHHFKRSF